MISAETKKRWLIRLVVSTILGILGMFIAGPLIAYLVQGVKATVASGEIASGFWMRFWVGAALFVAPWILSLTVWWHRKKTKKYTPLAILMVLLCGIGYTFLRVVFAVQFYEFWKIDGVFQYINLRYFNLGRHMIVGMLAGFILSIIIGFVLKRKNKI